MKNLFKKLINKKTFGLEFKEVNYTIETIMNDYLADKGEVLFKQRLDNY